MKARLSTFRWRAKVASRLALMLALFTCPPAFSQSDASKTAALSNLLPSAVIKEMTEADLPVLALDKPGSEVQIEIRRFWEKLSIRPLDPKTIIDQVFGAELKSFNREERELYTMKYLLLRHQVEKAPQDPELQALIAEFKNRYLETSMLVIALSDFAEIKDIARNFLDRLRKKEVHMRDLSPSLRSKIDSERQDSHGVRLLEKLPNSRRFQVSGLFHAQSGMLAVDFSRSVEENLVTFVHEMVHAADPQLEIHRANFRLHWPEVAKILVRFTGNPTQTVPLESLEHAFEKGELSKIETILEEANQLEQQKLQKKVEDSKLSDAEKQLLKDWVRSSIGLTVENEFRAYALSVVLYSKLRHRYKLFVDNISVLREFTERLLAGDRSFALKLSADIDGMARLSNFIRGSIRATSEEEIYLLQIVESFYLESMESFIRELGTRYSAEIPRETLREGLDRFSLPDWARPGGFDLPTNPYQIITARISTAWTIAFSNSLKRIQEEVSALNEPLWLMHAGILDLHDISIGELKVLGLHFTNSPYSYYPKELPEKLRQDVDSLPKDLQNLFALNHFDPKVQMQNDFVSGAEIRRKLTGLRLLRANLWMRSSLPPLNSSILGTRSFVEKLEKGIQVDHSEITPERRAELLSELSEALKMGSQVYQQLSTLRTLNENLSTFILMAEQSNLVQVARDFENLVSELHNIIENYGLANGQENIAESVKSRLSKVRPNFLKQLKKISESCKTLANRRQMGFFPGSADQVYNIEGYKFSPMILCWDRKIYVVRQPGDYTEFMTTTLRNGKPLSRIFLGARPIELEEISTTSEIR